MITRDQLAGTHFQISPSRFEELFKPLRHPAPMSEEGIHKYAGNDRSDLPDNRTWSLIYIGGGKKLIKNGRHSHNVMGFIACEVPLEDGISVTVICETWCKIVGDGWSAELLDQRQVCMLLNERRRKSRICLDGFNRKSQWIDLETKERYWELSTVLRYIEHAEAKRNDD